MLNELSNQIADVVDAASPSVVQVQGHRGPASGIVFAADLVLTTARAVGRAEHPRIRRPDGQTLEAEIAGFDPATRLVLLRTPGLEGRPLQAGAPARTGQIALAIARSWSNVVTATAGLVSVVGGPLATGRGLAIDRVIRTSAPMHEGFAGGALVGAEGTLLGIATATAIRGLGVVIPADIAWATAARLGEHGTAKRGYLGISAQPVGVTGRQKETAGADQALLVISVKSGSPAEAAGVLVGDLLISVGGKALGSAEDLLDLLSESPAGQSLVLQVLRGATAHDVTVTVGER